jgi:transglutaminase-like putative cysteine protease
MSRMLPTHRRWSSLACSLALSASAACTLPSPAHAEPPAAIAAAPVAPVIPPSALLDVQDAADPRLAQAKVEERWYVLRMQGQRAGWLQSLRWSSGGVITSLSRTNLELRREALKIGISVETRFIETDTGTPLLMSSTQKLGAMATSKKITFQPDGSMVVTTSQPTPTGALENTETRPPRPPGEKPWLPPAAAERYIEAELAKGAEQIIVTTLDPALGESPVTVTRTILERTTAEAFGRTVPAVKWKSKLDTMRDAEVIEFVDTQGETIRSEVNLGGISLVQLLADKDLARSKMDAPELLASTLVQVTPINSPRTTTRAVYRLTSVRGDLPELPTLAGQTFTRTSPTEANVAVLAGPEARLAEPADTLDATRTAHLGRSQMVNIDDPELQALAKRVQIKPGASDADKAEAVRRFVHGFITAKDMSVGFATASEVCRTRTGDCTEHAVLTAALLRLHNIPSRVASGLIYVDEFAGQRSVFGYHMWTQALIDGAWVNLDATLPDATPYDAAHITLSVSSLSEGEVQNFLVTTAPLIGRLDIKVLEAK